MPKQKLIPHPNLPQAGGFTTAIIEIDRRQPGVVHFAVFDPEGRQAGYLRTGSACWIGWRELHKGEYFVEQRMPVRSATDGLRTLASIIQDGSALAWFRHQHDADPVPFGSQHALV